MDTRSPTETPPRASRFSNASRGFERIVVTALIAMLMIVVVLSTVELGWMLVVNFVTPPFGLLGADELIEFFGFFLLLLIGVELIETVKAYLKHDAGHIEVVLEVALIAIARKVIALDTSKVSSGGIAGIAALIIALAIAVAVVRRGRATNASV